MGTCPRLVKTLKVLVATELVELLLGMSTSNIDSASS
jgi:hypothetical protein